MRITCPNCRGRSWSELPGENAHSGSHFDARCLECGTEYRRRRAGRSPEQQAREAEWVQKLTAWGLADLLPRMTVTVGLVWITHEFPCKADAERFCRKVPDSAPYDFTWAQAAGGPVTVRLHCCA